MKTNKKEEESNNPTFGANIELIYNNSEIGNKNYCSVFKRVFLFTISDMVAQLSPVIFFVIKEGQHLAVKQVNLNSSLLFNIIFIMIFSRIILHTKFYKHHIFAFSIDILFLFVLTITDIFQIYNDKGVNIEMSIIYILIKILSVILYSLQNSLAKYILLHYHFTSYSLLVYKSIFQFFYLLIFSFPFIFIKIGNKGGEPENIFYMIGDIFQDKEYIVIVIGYTIISFFCNNIGMKIIDVFSPNHFIIGKLLERVGIFLCDLIINGNDSIGYLLAKIVLYILLLLSSFIFNEYLVLNFCGLSKNTKLFLDYEVEQENLIDEEKDESEDINSIEKTETDDIIAYNNIELKGFK